MNGGHIAGILYLRAQVWEMETATMNLLEIIITWQQTVNTTQPTTLVRQRPIQLFWSYSLNIEVI